MRDQSLSRVVLFVAMFGLSCNLIRAPIPSGSVAVTSPAVVLPTSEAIETPEGLDPNPPPEVVLNRQDVSSVIAFVQSLIERKEPGPVVDLVGPEGAAFVAYGIEALRPGYDNGAEVAAELEAAMPKSNPICIGHNPDFDGQGQKAIVYFDGLNVDWGRHGLATQPGAVTEFQFWLVGQDWELVWITPIPPDLFAPDSLQPCPGG